MFVSDCKVLPVGPNFLLDNLGCRSKHLVHRVWHVQIRVVLTEEILLIVKPGLEVDSLAYLTQ